MLAREFKITFDRCTCRSFHQDARASRFDPSGSGAIRLSLRTAMVSRLRKMRSILRDQLITNDLLGLNMGSVSSSMTGSVATAGGATKVKVFQAVVDDALKNTFLGADGSYIRPYVQKAYDRGQAFASKNAKASPTAMTPQDEKERVDTLNSLTYSEMQGIAEAVSQQLVRIAADGILTKKSPAKMLAAMNVRLERTGVSRIKALADFTVTRTFNEATLDTYKLAGVESVGLVPERRKPKKVLGDAIWRDARRGTGAGSRISRAVVPSRSTVSRIRKSQARLEAIGAVNVQTAEDDDVCPICEDISENGPYGMDTARSLIPAHPYCRCVFIPVDEEE